MSALKGCFLVPTTKNPDTGLWFIFHHESDGILAFDVTSEHSDITYKNFESVLDGEDRKNREDKIVLHGGPLQSDKALIILHNKPAGSIESHIINDDFSFLSYRYVVVPGQPPSIAKADDTPTRIDMQTGADFIVVIGFRLWEMDILEQELKDWQWTLLPATQDLVFHTSAGERLQKARRSIN